MEEWRYIYIYLNPIKIVKKKKKSGRNKFKCTSDYSNENGINLSNKWQRLTDWFFVTQLLAVWRNPKQNRKHNHSEGQKLREKWYQSIDNQRNFE